MRALRVQTPSPVGARQAPCRPRPARAQVAVRAQPVAGQGKVYIDPVEKEAAAFAPATVANLGPGFDWMGCAVEVRSGALPCSACALVECGGFQHEPCLPAVCLVAGRLHGWQSCMHQRGALRSMHY